MVQLIVGNKGKGKTKQLLDKVNNEIEKTKGNIVYLDKSTKHMFELNNRIRLIDVSDYLVTNDKHFDVLKNKSFPLINILNAEEFKKFCIS